MRVPEQDYTILADFVDETLEGVRRATPFVRALVEQPDREDILPRVSECCFHLFHSIKGTAAFLQLEQLVRPAEAMEYLLDRIRSGVQNFTPRLVSLLAESCQFMEKGLPLVMAEKSDERLEPAAKALTAALVQAMQAGGGAAWGPRGASEPAEMPPSFFQESEALLATVEQEFVLWDFIAMDQQRIAGLCRLLHRLQQNFTLFALRDLDRLCLALGATLRRYLHGEFFQTEYPERVFLHSVDALRSALTGCTGLGDGTVIGLESHLAALQGLVRQPIGRLLVEAGLVGPQVVVDALELQKSTQGGAPRRLGEVLVDMGEVTPDQIEQVLQMQHGNRRRMIEAEAALSSASPPRVQPPLIDAVYDEIAIDGRKFARMVALVNQLAAVYQPQGDAAAPFMELIELTRSCNREVLAGFCARLKRMVHDLAMHARKRVYFVIEGIDTILDQRDIILLADPLFELLENSVRHGLETVEERVLAGKSKSGKLTLTALEHGAELWVSIEDDGVGVGREKFAALAVAQGLVAAEGVDRLTPRELAQLFFRSPPSPVPGQADGGGQGAGLAAVRDRVLQLQGRVEMLSRPDRGTRITLKIPRQP